MRLSDRGAAQNAQVQESASAPHAPQDTEGQRALPVPSCPGAFPLRGGIHSLEPALQEVFSGSIFHLEWKEGLEQAHVLHMCLEVALMILKSVRAMGHRDFCPAARGRKSILNQTWPRHVHHSFPNCLRCLMCSALLSQTCLMYLFPTCQVRVVRFYQNCSPPPPRLAVLLLLVLLLQFLLDHVCINFHLHFRLAISSPSSLPTSQLCTAGPQPGTFPAQCAPLCTAGPQPGTCPAQCAPLDLNLGPAQLSVHRWTSTWDLPSSVCIAGPQPGTFPVQCAPLDLNLGPAQLSVHRWTSTAR